MSMRTIQRAFEMRRRGNLPPFHLRSQPPKGTLELTMYFSSPSPIPFTYHLLKYLFLNSPRRPSDTFVGDYLNKVTRNSVTQNSKSRPKAEISFSQPHQIQESHRHHHPHRHPSSLSHGGSTSLQHSRYTL
jgi:hypothetical protein